MSRARQEAGGWAALGAVSALALGAGLVLEAVGRRPAAELLWTVATVAALVPLAVVVVRDAWRRRPGIDVIAVLAMGGALALHEPFAGAVLALMLATGRLLERFAAGRAERALAALHARAPRTAQRAIPGGYEEVPVDRVKTGDTLLVREGDVVPVDGVVTDDRALLDESALTGEARPIERTIGEPVASGTANAGPPFRMRATSPAAASTYAGIVELVERARASKAPMARLADRAALAFVPLTLGIAAATWALSGDAKRALAILVVATPCPLLLAVPIAILGGISRLARRGVIVKGGGALETIARTERIFLDKTGTITVGAPRVTRVVPASGGPDASELLALAAAADRASSHVFAAAFGRAAAERGIEVPASDGTRERRGSGVEATVAGHVVRVGRLDWVAPDEASSEFAIARLREGDSVVFVALDGRLAGAIQLDDPIRVETPAALRALRRAGVREIIVLTGDHAVVAQAVAGALGVDRVMPEHDPAGKEAAVRNARGSGVVAMVGDGINDAAALASADVGIAIGARGATVASEAADVVIVADRFDRIVDAIVVARRTRAVVLQSVAVGMGLSFVAVGFAAAGLLAPALGAIVQEGIDALALGLALRAAAPGADERRRARTRSLLPAAEAEALRAEHDRLVPFIDRLRQVADGLDDFVPAERSRAFHEVRRIVSEDLVRHERADDAVLYPALARRMPGDDPLAALSRTHQEIFRMAEQLERRLENTADADVDRGEIRRLLYGLHAVLELHFAQEAELFFQVSDGARVGNG